MRMFSLLNAALYSGRNRFPTGVPVGCPSSPAIHSTTVAAGWNRGWVWVAVAVLALTGCQPTTSRPRDKGGATASDSAAGGTENVQRPAVPLRVWCVADQSASDRLQRQWQASSDRTLELRWFTPAQLLQSQSCDCDVVIYPAQLLGELVDRDWLAELPSSGKAAPALGMSSSSSSAAVDPTSDAFDATAGSSESIAGVEQSRYGKRSWAMSLGVTTPVLLSNFALPASFSEEGGLTADAVAYWSAVEAALRDKVGDRPAAGLASDQIDATALCDRFLLVAMSLAERESRFGVTLDPESLKSRLTSEAALQAAEIIWRLTQLNPQPLSVAGSHEAAWLALQQDQPGVTIGLPPSPTPEVDAVTKISAYAPPEAFFVGRAKRTQGWNSGHGLIVSIAKECRQTAQSTGFVRWLTTDATRTVLARRWDGVAADSTYPPGSSAWQTQRIGRRLVQQPHLPLEPRWMRAWECRQILGEALASMVRGQATPSEALKGAAAAWDRLNSDKERTRFQVSVEQSLGL